MNESQKPEFAVPLIEITPENTVFAAIEELFCRIRKKSMIRKANVLDIMLSFFNRIDLYIFRDYYVNTKINHIRLLRIRRIVCSVEFVNHDYFSIFATKTRKFETMNNPIETAFTAFGMSGLVFHGPLIESSPNFHLKKVWERTKNLSKQKYEQVEVVRDYQDILTDEEIELIVITSPDYLHYEHTKLALNAGKHVVVEKPFTITIQEGLELIELADKKNLVLSVFHNRRWDGDFMTVKRVIEKKLTGRLITFESHWERYRNFIKPGTWKEDPIGRVGCLHDLGSHMIDQALVLFGMPEKIHADLGIVRSGGKTPDFYDLKLYYEKVKVRLTCTYLAREQGPRYVLHGTEGSFLKWGIDPQEEDLKQGKLPSGSNWGLEQEKDHGVLHTTINNLTFKGKIETIPGNYPAFYDNIYKAVRDGQSLAVKPKEALNVIKVIEAAVRSSREDKVVTL